MLIVLKSGKLNFLETSGHVQACNGIALPLPLSLTLPLRNTLGHDKFLGMLMLYIQEKILTPYRVRAIVAVAIREMETVRTKLT
jgi:hypothetical protein